MNAAAWDLWTSVGALTAASVPLLLVARALRRRRAREARLARPFSADEESVLDRNFPRWRELPPEWQRRFAGTTRVLMEEKNYEACGGLSEVTAEMRLTIAAQAAMSLVGHDGHRFLPRLRSVLVYPGGFRDLGRRRFGIDDERRGVLHGESWETGSVVLSWQSVVAGGRNADDGMNVVIHEFAHQLDQYDGVADGVPRLASPEAEARWREAMGTAYRELVKETEEGREPFIDPYGATHPCEFFAVVSESFFETPRELLEGQPEVYGELARFYGLDPAVWDRGG